MIILLMILIGFGFIVYSLIAILKEPKNFENILKSEEENSEPWQIELGRVRSEFAITLSEMQSEILKMSEEVEKFQSDKHLHLNNTINEDAVIRKNKEDNIELIKVGKNKIDRNKLKKMYKKEENIDETIKEVEKTTISEEKKESKSILVEQIQDLIKEGYSLDEISETLSIGKGEVLLIKQLYIN